MWKFILFVSILNTLFFSFPIFRKLTNYNFGIIKYSCISIILFILSIALSNIFYSLILWDKKISKITVCVIFLTNAFALYFMNAFNIAIDKNIIINIFETDARESTAFITTKLFIYVILLGILPSIFISKLTIVNDMNKYYHKIKLFLYSILTVIIIIAPCYTYKPAFLFLRHNQTSLNFLIPLNYFGGTISYTSKYIERKFSNQKLFDISKDAVLTKQTKRKNLIVFVIGESARANHFSINGYERETDYLLKKYDIISFKNFTSCDNMTETALLCTFSRYSQEEFDYSKTLQEESLIHILDKVGYKVYWRSNNGRCKQTACKDNTISHSIVKSFGTELYDDLLLKVSKLIFSNNNDDNTILFLHQWGSHGPIYSEKYPEKFKKYTPDCQGNITSGCSLEEVRNAYDNTLYYTSYLLSELISELKKKDDYNVALIYMSDHGESIGENGIFMHSLHPVSIAPYEQKNPAFFIWLSSNFIEDYNLDFRCIKNKKDNTYSQDNIFHSMLGLLGIKSQYYNKNLDIFSSCIK